MSDSTEIVKCNLRYFLPFFLRYIEYKIGANCLQRQVSSPNQTPSSRNLIFTNNSITTLQFDSIDAQSKKNRENDEKTEKQKKRKVKSNFIILGRISRKIDQEFLIFFSFTIFILFCRESLLHWDRFESLLKKIKKLSNNFSSVADLSSYFHNFS